MTRQESLRRRLAMAEEARTGVTIDAIARKYHVCTTTVGLACKEHGVTVYSIETTSRRVPTPPYKAPRPTPLGRMKVSSLVILAKLFDPELSFSKIAKAHGVCYQQVQDLYKRARKAGVPLPVRYSSGTARKKSAG